MALAGKRWVEGSSENVVWLKCPGSQGFLPYMTDEEAEGESGGEAGELVLTARRERLLAELEQDKGEA